MDNITKKKKRHIIRPSRIILLIVLLAGNTFAWFIYATKINTDVSVHVRAWNVVFESGDTEISNDISIPINNVFPGMEDYEYSITAYNRSEVSASLSYQVLSARIMNQEYVSVEEKRRLGLTINEDDLTSLELEDMLANDFPFSITIDTSGQTISSENGQETYSISVVWPYESNDDAADTLWGTNAYQYKQSNPDDPSISINIKITITQNAS